MNFERSPILILKDLHIWILKDLHIWILKDLHVWILKDLRKMLLLWYERQLKAPIYTM